MRNTLTIEDDVAAAIELRRRKFRHSLKHEVNYLLRAGLIHVEQQQAPSRPFKVQPLPVGECLIDNFDKISEVLAIAEGEDYR